MSYWADKWARAQDTWEERRVKEDTVDEVYEGLTVSGRAQYEVQPKEGTRDFHQLLRHGQVGRTVDVGPVTDEISILEIEGPDEYAQVMAVTLDVQAANGVSPIPTLQDPFIAVVQSCRARVDFGVGGLQSSAFVDMNHGVSFSVPAAFLRINAARIPDVGLPVVIPEFIKVGAKVTYGVPAGIRRPTLTFRRDSSLAIGATVDLIVPPFATAFTVFWRLAGGGPPTIGQSVAFEFFTLGFATGVGGAIYSNSVSSEAFIAIPNGTAIMRMTNTTGIAIELVIVYGLSI